MSEQVTLSFTKEEAKLIAASLRLSAEEIGDTGEGFFKVIDDEAFAQADKLKELSLRFL